MSSVYFCVQCVRLILPQSLRVFRNDFGMDGNYNVSVEQIEREKDDDISDTTKLEDGELLLPDVRVEAERQLVRTLDMRLLPTIIIIFIMNYIDVSSKIIHRVLDC